jgi:hypothetical protein
MTFAFGPFGPVELTDEQKEELQRHRELTRMAKEDSQRSMDRMLEKLDVDDLICLKSLLQATINGEGDDFASYMIGWISSILHNQYGVCLNCGVKHDDDFPVTEEAP